METHGTPVGRDEATAQLAALQADRAELADRVVQPWWHDVACGLLLFGIVAANAIEPSWAGAMVTLACAAGFALVVWTYWKRVGVWAYPGGRQWGTWLALVAVVLGPAFLFGEDHVWLYPVAGAVLGVALAVLSRRWSRQWAAELRSGA